VGEVFCAALDLSDDDACGQAAYVCLSWWEKRDDEVEIDNMLWEMSERRINELACDPYMARAYLAERKAD
jgi:hypothetical protein